MGGAITSLMSSKMTNETVVAVALRSVKSLKQCILLRGYTTLSYQVSSTFRTTQSSFVTLGTVGGGQDNNLAFRNKNWISSDCFVVSKKGTGGTVRHERHERYERHKEHEGHQHGCDTSGISNMNDMNDSRDTSHERHKT